MKSWLPKFVTAALVLGCGIGLAQAQQSGDRPMPGHGPQGQHHQPGQGTGSSGTGMGMRSGMMQMMPSMMGEDGRCGGMERGMRAHSGMMTPVMFAIMDADGDGALSLQEFQEAHARIFKHIDADKDGRVKMEDIEAFFRSGVH